MNPNRNNGNNANTTPVMFGAGGGGNGGGVSNGGASASNAPVTTCSCGNLMNPSNGGNANAFNININNGAYNDGSAANSADTLLSSNAKFQAISAIAVSQDGVINVADQGMYPFHICIYTQQLCVCVCCCVVAISRSGFKNTNQAAFTVDFVFCCCFFSLSFARSLARPFIQYFGFGFCHGMNSFIMNFIEADVFGHAKTVLMASTVYSK